MHLIRTVPVLALLAAGCRSDANKPPATDEPLASAAPVAVDTGTAPPRAPGAAIASVDDGRPVTLARWPGGSPAETHEALLNGTLVAEGGCLWVVGPTGYRYLVLWPDGVDLVAGAVPARLADRRSGASAQVGGPVRLGGGEVPDSSALDASLPPGCRGPLWLASGIIAADATN